MPRKYLEVFMSALTSATDAVLSLLSSDTVSSFFSVVSVWSLSCFLQPAKAESARTARTAAINLRIFIKYLPLFSPVIHIIAYFPEKRYRF